MTSPAHTAPDRFAVASAGMSQLHSGRRPDHLIKELVQNAFDENPKTCRVTVHSTPDGVLVTVSDDGPGFSDIANAYTLMADTPKRLNPEKRGRFNLGDKEVISVSTWSKIETVGWTVTFPQEGGRQVTPNRKKNGTTVTALMPWDQAQADDLSDRLAAIRPPENTVYRINGKRVHRPIEMESIRAPLPTVVQAAPSQPLRNSVRQTQIHIISPGNSQESILYEIGIPIQPITTPYHIDVLQKVPMPPNRDTVSDAYLKQLYTIVLNAMHTHMRTEEFGQAWVKTAIENSKVLPEAVKKTINERYGPKVVTWSSDTDANMNALDNGYQVLHPKTISKPELDNMRTLGGMPGAKELFGRDPSPGPDVDVTGDKVKEQFAQWVVELGLIAGKSVTTNFVNNPKTRMLASCTANSDNPVMTFNIAQLGDNFFAARGQHQLHLIIHELAHAFNNSRMSHGPKWGEACAHVGAVLSKTSLDLPDRASQQTELPLL